MAVLRAAGAEALVHCGDVGGPDVVDVLAGWRGWLVAGNTDDDDLVPYAAAHGLTATRAGPLRVECAGRSLLVFHGHEGGLGALLDSLAKHGTVPANFGRCDYVLHGHTHAPRDLRLGPVRVINPGALCRAAVHTVATLDLRADAVRFWRVNEDAPVSAPQPFRPGRH